MSIPVPTIPLSQAIAAVQAIEAERDMWREMTQASLDQLTALGKRLAVKDAVAQLRAPTSGVSDAESNDESQLQQ